MRLQTVSWPTSRSRKASQRGNGRGARKRFKGTHVYNSHYLARSFTYEIRSKAMDKAKKQYGWHFCGATLRDGAPIPPDGEWLEFEGPVKMCEKIGRAHV